MKSQLRTRGRHVRNRADLVYAGVVAMIICAGLIGRAAGILPLR